MNANTSQDKSLLAKSCQLGKILSNSLKLLLDDRKGETMTRIAIVATTALCAVTMVPVAVQAETVLRWASQGDALTFDPHSQNEGPTSTANKQVYEPLIMRGPDLVKEPGLALSWEPIEPTVWEFKLREGVKFHGGEDFTAEDVAFSIGRAKAESSDFKEYLTSVSEVRVVDDMTVHLVTDGPNPILTEQLDQILMMDSGWAEANNVTEPAKYADGEENYAVRNANGTGPFKLAVREPDVRTIMEKNGDWWGSGTEGNPHGVDKIVYTPIENAATRVAALLSGEVDFLLDPPLQDLKRIESTPGLVTQSTPQIRTIFFGMDTGVDELRSSNVKGANPFADERVRQAMYQSINIEAIQSKVMRGLSEPAGIITAPGVHGFNEDLDARLDYDVEAAKALMAEAGYPDGFEVQLDCPNNRYNNDEAICQAAVGMLAQIGIKVKLDAIPKSQHFPKIQNRVSDFYMLGWGVPTLDSHYVFSFLYDSEGSWNATGFNDARLDELVDSMAVETDLAARDEMIAEAWDIVKAANVYLPLHHQVIAWAMKDNVELPMQPEDSPEFRWAAMK